MLICSSVSPVSLRGVRIGCEALEWGATSTTTATLGRSFEGRITPTLILGSFHRLARKIEPNTSRSIPGDKIFIVQLADAPLIDMDLLYWSRRFRNMPGEGDLPVVDFMRAVAATGYGGPLSLEIFHDQFRGGSARAIAEDGHRSLVNLMDQVVRQQLDIRIDVPQMPDRIATRGVEFVEFTTRAEEKRTSAISFTRNSCGLARLLHDHPVGRACCAHSIVPNNRTSLNNKGSKMAALRQIAFYGKGYRQVYEDRRPIWHVQALPSCL